MMLSLSPPPPSATAVSLVPFPRRFEKKPMIGAQANLSRVPPPLYGLPVYASNAERNPIDNELSSDT